MGCSASSFLDRDRTVTGRCREREHFIKLCVQNQHAFAAAHAAYIRSLRNTGAAIRQFGEGEQANTGLLDHGHGDNSETNADALPQSMRSGNAPLHGRHSITCLPPPRPDFMVTPNSLPRTSSMPPLRSTGVGKILGTPLPSRKLDFAEESSEVESQHPDVKPPPPLPADMLTPPPAPPASTSSQWELYNVFPRISNSDVLDLKEEDEEEQQQQQRGGLVKHAQESAQLGGSHENTEFALQKVQSSSCLRSFGSVLRELDDHFLAAFEAGRDVARLLQGRQTHYHSNSAGSTGSLNHSSRVLRVMSWGRYPNFSEDGREVDIFYDDEKETHASTLDKLLAWEKKLHDDVKAGEIIRIRLERKSHKLKKQKKHENGSALKKTRSIVKNLQTRYLVEVQAVDAASTELEKLRDVCLYKQLADLVQKSMIMWRSMLECHLKQYHIVESMQLNNVFAPIATTESNIKNTLQLESEVNIWRRNLESLINTQKEYVFAVHRWLCLHIIEIESSSKRGPSSPPKMSSPPVYALCKTWLSVVNQITGNVALNALKTLSNTIHELKVHQTEELKQHKRLEHLRKDLERKEQNLKIQEMKASETFDRDELERLRATGTHPTKSMETSVKLLRDRVESEKDKYDKMCIKSRSMAVSTLQKGLPPIFNHMKEFACACLQQYTQLYYISVSDDGPVLQISY